MRTLIGLLTLFCILIPASQTFGESHEFCDNYAKAAILQYQEAQALGMNTPFPVWSDNYKHHYDWCRTQPLQPVENGHALRQEQIETYKKSYPKAMPGIITPAAPKKMIPAVKVTPATATQKPVSISNLTVTSGRNYLTSSPVRAGNNVFIDRPFSVTKLPQELINSVQIVTANDDKFSDADKPFLKFTVDQPVVVYIAYDRRYKAMPAWLQSFGQLRKSVVYSVAGGTVTDDLYQKHFSAGEVILGGNIPKGSKDNFSMYMVFVVQAKSAMTSSGEKTPRQELINDVRDKISRFDALIAKELSNYNQRLDQAVRDHVAWQKKVNADAFNALPTPDQIAAHLVSSVPNDGNPYSLDLQDYEAIPQKVGESINLQKKKKYPFAVLAQQPSDMMLALKPVKLSGVPVDGLAQIVSFPGTDALEPGDWVYISGVGFGNSPGTILIQYTVNTDEFGAKWDTKTLTIAPGTHQLTWHDNLIVFRLPKVLPYINSTDLGKGQGIGKAALTLQLKTGATISRPVKIDVAKIRLVDVWTDSSIDVTYYVPKADDHWVKFKDTNTRNDYYSRMPDKMAPDNLGITYKSIEPGSEVSISGSGFGDAPGQVEILVGKKKVPIIPMGKDWWSNFGIRFKVGDIPGHLSREVGFLTIKTSDGQVLSNPQECTFVYGPEMTVKVVSGNKWFEPEWDEDSSYAKPDANDLALFVSHDPGCGWFKTSESGWDYFFRTKKLPQGVILKHFTFMEIEHENANDQLNYLKNYLKDILFSLEGFGVLDVALGFIIKNFKIFVGAVTDSFFGDGGGYFAYLPQLPTANVDSPSVGVMWENACTGANSGLPIMYMTTFVVTGPKAVLSNM